MSDMTKMRSNSFVRFDKKEKENNLPNIDDVVFWLLGEFERRRVNFKISTQSLELSIVFQIWFSPSSGSPCNGVSEVDLPAPGLFERRFVALCGSQAFSESPVTECPTRRAVCVLVERER